ncbi:MAG: PEP-CTERM sorting domain-containing protein [Fimbriimonadaceae bacterium]|nr:PEP-CTERM sorting domain-containing protein [Fimbriimonadaceae bacterium]
MKKIAFATLTLGLVAFSATASASYSFTGATINEDFDSLPSSGTFSSIFGPGSAQAAVPGGTQFVGARVGGSSGSAMNFVINDGLGNSGALYSYGTGSSSDRALGSLASATHIPGFGFEMVNNSGAAITSVTLRFTAEFWRSSTLATNTLSAFYGVSGGAINASNFITEASMTAITSWDVVGPAFVASNGALDGNDPLNQATVFATLTLSTPLANGGSFFVAWRDFNDVGNDAGLAIDNLAISATTDAVPEPATMAVLAAAGLAAAARRKRK